jgi:hypothetical protein
MHFVYSSLLTVSCTAVLQQHQQLVPYLQPILGALVAASHKYQVRSSVVLYDAIGTLADVMGQHLVQPQVSELLKYASKNFSGFKTVKYALYDGLVRALNYALLAVQYGAGGRVMCVCV